MNSYMNIQVRVIGTGAMATLKALQRQIAIMNGTVAAGAGAQAKNTAATRAGTAATAAQAGTVAKATAAMRVYNAQMHAGVGHMNKWGNRTQWTGRQLQRNWTLPLLLAGGAAVKFALDNEKAFVHTEKVYGDAAAAQDYFLKKGAGYVSQKEAEAQATAVFSAELDALKLNFEAVSERYGVALKEVNEISGAWAAAGYSGAALAKAVDTTMQAVMLGNMDAATATKALIATQGQYRLNSEELIDTLYVLNAVENQTGIELSGLVEGFSRSAGVARAAGVGVRELAAQLAALVPTAGTAAQAGNALKTIYSRLLAPTGDTVDILGAMGINIADVAWKSANLADRLHMVTTKFNGLSDAQKANAASVLGSRWQFNKLIILLDELQNKTGPYARALAATSDETKIYNQAQQELNAILDSSPNKLKRVWVAIQNGMANAIAPLIPVIISLFDGIRQMVKAFQSLSPEMQKFWIFAGLGLAVLPLIVVYIGSLFTLLATLGGIFVTVIPLIYGATAALVKFAFALLIGGPAKIFAMAISAMAGALIVFVRLLRTTSIAAAAWGALVSLGLFGPWGIAIGAVIALLLIFRREVVSVWNSIVSYFSDSSNGMVKAVLSAWYALPQGVANALTAVVRVVAQAAMQIYEWLSYLNPFARHSPSLVDNVTAGTARISQLYGAMTAKISGHIKGAYQDIKAYGAAVAHLLKGASSFEEAQNRAKIKKFAPGALDEYIQLGNRLRQLQKDLAGLQRAMDAQQTVVDRWTAKLEAANEALDKQQDLLDKLTETADKWRDKLNAAQESLAYYANAPLEGMHAANEAIFANEMAQKALRLEMMRIEEVTGPLDELKSKMDAINGAQELLRGEQTALRNAGAGSDILSGYQEQIDLLDQQKVAYEDAIAPLNAMQDQLEELQRQAEIMDLEKSLQFDPLTHAIQNAANAMEELPFDEVMAGITAAQADIALYTTKWEEANAAVQAQQAVVDAATEARDRLQDRLDIEQKKLDDIKDAYDAVNQAIGDIESTMNDVMAAADKMADKLKKAAGAGGAGGAGMSPALESFGAAAGGNFPDVGGSGMPNRKDWESQVADIEKMTDELQQKTADMFGKLNPFKPIKEKASAFFGWTKDRLSAFSAGAKNFFVDMLGGPDGARQAGDTFLKIFATARRVFRKIGAVIMAVWDLLGPEVMETADIIRETLINLWQDVGPEVKKFGALIEPAFKVFKTIVIPILAIVGGALLGVVKILWSMLNNTIRPVFNGIVTIVKGSFQVIRGLMEVILGLLTLDFGMALQGLKDMFIGTFTMIWGILKGIFGGIWGLISGFVEGIWGFFVWLYDVLIGHSVIPDIIDGIWFWFRKLINLGVWVWNNVLKPVWNFAKKLWDVVGPELQKWGSRIKNAWNGLLALGTWVWNNILKPIWNRFTTAKDNVLKVVEAIRTGFREKFDSMRQKASDVVEWIRDIPNKLENQVSRWKSAGKALIDAFVNGMKNAAGIISGIAGNVWDAVKSQLNAAIDKINSALEFTIDLPGPKNLNVNIANIPHLYTGGIVRGSQRGMLAVLGDKGYDEAVIPINGPWAPKGVGSREGMRSGTIGGRGGDTHLHFYGDLEFPNVKNGDDAKDLIEHLTILAEGA